MGTALVTGGTSGIGLAFARQLAEEGHDLVLVARGQERLDTVAQEIRRTIHPRVEVMAADLSVRDDVHRVADRLADASLPVDILVNNAGFGLKRSFLDSELSEQEEMLDVLCRTVMVTCHAAGRTMTALGHGTIINVSSVAGFSAMGTYSAAKAWVTTFTEVLAGELRGTGVTATALCPGFVRTGFHERAVMNMSALPERLWLDADDVVAQCLEDVARGKVISIPSKTYKAVTFATRHAPRPVVRAMSGGLRRRRSR